MIIQKISIDHFKNLSHVEFAPHARCNLLCGGNAQGKTNLLEAIWMLSGCHSFRGLNDRDAMPFSGGVAEISCKFLDTRRKQRVRLTIGEAKPGERRFWANGVRAVPKEMLEIFHAAVFTPEDIALINGSPERRRNFLDLCLSQLHPSFLPSYRRYYAILAQRNAFLKAGLSQKKLQESIGIWDTQLAKEGSVLAMARVLFVEALRETILPIYARISGGGEKVAVRYKSTVFGESQDRAEMEQIYLERLTQSLSADLEQGFTGAGIHRDDLNLMIDDHPARTFASQGQKKSLALALKLGAAQIYEEQCHESPVMLLDDVMGELDRVRQRVVWDLVSDMQVFVTTPHFENVGFQGEGRVFRVSRGCVEAEKG